MSHGDDIRIENQRLKREAVGLLQRIAELERSDALRGERLLQSLIDAAPFGAHEYKLEPDGQLVFIAANRAADRILRVDNQAFVGKTLDEAFPALAGGQIPEAYRSVAETGVPYETELVEYHEGQISGVFEVSAFQTGPGRVVALFRDITERARAEEARRQAQAELRASEDRFRSLVQNSSDLITLHDAEGRIFYSTPSTSRLLGYPEGSIEGQTPLELVHPDDLSLVLRSFADVVASRDRSQPVEFRVRHANGSWVYIEAVGQNFLDHPGIQGVLITSREITERKLAEKALRDSEERYRRITESLTDYVYTLRFERGRPVETKYGAGSIAVTGYTADEWASIPGLWQRILVPEDLPAATEQARRAVTGHKVPPAEFRIVRKDGSLRWVRSTTVPQFASDGSLLSCDFLIQDVTERRTLQNQLLQVQKMESIGRLAGGIAHDFNNLLTIILGFSEMVQSNLPPEHPASADIREVLEAARRAADLISKLLGFARRQVVSPRILDLNAIVRDTEKLLRPILGEDIEVILQTDPNLGKVQADPGQVGQLLFNLAANARDAMPKGGTLTIGTANRRVEEGDALKVPDVPPGSYVMLTVRDSGVGMSDEARAHAFEPFFTTKEPGRGTGLGLATCHGIVKQNNGHILLESEAGRGTSFQIYLPRVHTEPSSGVYSVDQEPARRGNETVLLVEDDVAVRSLAALSLRATGYRVLEAADGASALAVAREHTQPIQLLVTDVVMQGMSGQQLAERFAEIHRESRRLYMSGYAQDGLAPGGIAGPHIPILQKPFTPDRLVRKVREVLDAPAANG